MLKISQAKFSSLLQRFETCQCYGRGEGEVLALPSAELSLLK